MPTIPDEMDIDRLSSHSSWPAFKKRPHNERSRGSCIGQGAGSGDGIAAASPCSGLTDVGASSSPRAPHSLRLTPLDPSDLEVTTIACITCVSQSNWRFFDGFFVVKNESSA